MRRSTGILLGLAVVGVVLLAMPATALGDVSWQYPCSGDVLSPAACERLTAIYNEGVDIRQLCGWAVGCLLVVAIAPVFYRTFRR